MGEMMSKQAQAWLYLVAPYLNEILQDVKEGKEIKPIVTEDTHQELKDLLNKLKAKKETQK